MYMIDGGYIKKTGCLLMFLVLIAFTGAHAKDYVIGGGDSLNISVWGSPELSIEITVRPDGKISMPALGEIRASGFTPNELTDILVEEMKKVVKQPIVTVIVTQMTNYKIFVFGRGGTPGVYTLSNETSLLEFLSQLGPLENADLQNSYLVRNKEKIKTGFYKLFEKGDFNQDIILEPSDMLFIPDNYENKVSIVGAVNNPTSIPFREELTILDVIISAGGFTEFAKENDVQILRKGTDDSKEELSVRAKDLMKKGNMKENILMMPGDFVIVKEKMF